MCKKVVQACPDKFLFDLDQDLKEECTKYTQSCVKTCLGMFILILENKRLFKILNKYKSISIQFILSTKKYKLIESFIFGKKRRNKQ